MPSPLLLVLMCCCAVVLQMIQHVAAVHGIVIETSQQYYVSHQRHVSTTPRSFLSYLQAFLSVYDKKFNEIRVRFRVLVPCVVLLSRLLVACLSPLL